MSPGVKLCLVLSLVRFVLGKDDFKKENALGEQSILLCVSKPLVARSF